MADERIGRKDIFRESDLFEEQRKGAEAMRKVFEGMISDAKKLGAEMKKSIKDNPFKNAADVKKFNEAVKGVNQQYSIFDSASKARKKTLTDLEKARNRLLKSQKAENASVQLLNEKTARNNRLARENAKAILDSGNAYKVQSRQLNSLIAKYQDVALRTGRNSNESRKLAKEIRVLDKRLKDVDKSTGRFGRVVGKYPRILSAATAAFGGLIIGVSGFVRGIREAIRTTINYEKENSRLKAVLSGTSQEMAELRQQSQQLGSTTAFTASQVTAMQTELAKLGFPVQDIKNMTASTLDAAAAMGSSLAEQAKLTGATLKAFGLESTEAARVNDVLSAATTKSALDFEKLNNSMSTVAPVANAFGFSVEETTSLLGELSNAGFDASMAATATRNILLNLADANGKLAKRLKEPVKDLPSLVKGLKQLKDENIDLGEAFELTDKRSVAAFSTFLEGTDSVLELNDALEKAAGTAQEMADTQLDNLAGDIKILESAFEGFVLRVLSGDSAFSDFSRSLVQGVTRFLSLLAVTKDLNKENKTYVDTQLDAFKSSRDFSKANTDLVRTFERLNEKENLSNKERRELKKVTNELIGTFGDSATSINKETGELEVNIAAIKEKIALEQALNSEAAKNLISEKVRLESQIRIAEDAENRIKELRERFSEDANLLELINVPPEEAALFNNTLAQIRDGFLKTGEGAEEFENKLSVLLPALNRVRGAEFSLFKNREELLKINNLLLDLGIDLNEIAKVRATVTDGENKKAEKSIGLLERQRKKVKELRDELSKAQTLDQIIGIQLQLIKEEKFLKQLENIVDDVLKSIEDKVDESASKQAEIVNKQLEAIRAAEEKDTQKRLQAIEDRNNAIQNGIDVTNRFFEAQQRLADFEIQSINDKISANQRALETAERLGTEELAFRQQQAAKLELERERAAERQVKRQKIQSFFNLFAEFAKTDPNTAAVKALAQQAIANTIIGFFNEGTESVGGDTNPKWRSTGTDDYLAAVNKGEKIFNNEDSAKIGYDISNSQAADIVDSYKKGLLVPQESINHTYLGQTFDDSNIVQAVREVSRSLNNFRIDIDWNSQGEMIERTVKNGMTKVIKHVGGRGRI